MTDAGPTRALRELTKSALSFSWAISLLSVNRAASLLSKAQPGGDVLASMTEVATDQMDEFMKGIYRSGDNLQARIVDLAFSWINPAAWLSPEKWSALLPGASSPESSPQSSEQAAPSEERPPSQKN